MKDNMKMCKAEIEISIAVLSEANTETMRKVLRNAMQREADYELFRTNSLLSPCLLHGQSLVRTK